MMKKSRSIYYWARNRTFVIINDETRFVKEVFPAHFCSIEKQSLEDQLRSYELTPLFVLSHRDGEKKLAVYHPSLCNSRWLKMYQQQTTPRFNNFEEDENVHVDHEMQSTTRTPNNSEVANNNRQMLYGGGPPPAIAMPMTTTTATAPPTVTTNHHYRNNNLLSQNRKRAKVSNDGANIRVEHPTAAAGVAAQFAVRMSESLSSSLHSHNNERKIAEGRNVTTTTAAQNPVVAAVPPRHVHVLQPVRKQSSSSNSKDEHGNTATVLGCGGEDDWMCEHCMREIFKTYEECVAHEAICPCRKSRGQGKCGDSDEEEIPDVIKSNCTD
mmetsp:Transcript_18349/g.27261  ORF Transcript_18349/g.27261 Transcript_18349/m.27261 type:complete len:326 (-) Transcript_18349:277-1254(-)|eukprot:CAMPEP_0116018590 /NCGR_PEP_ID=MMETSP0321-20121206/8736_1 /TAXON_ID=163516 /ORGANISM="Leptocylindrus danicus var. danicus, Strain B650" /LENGTH=325 /DNA_ID=CAMNT_0003489007 /DNA_START=163 /DNA_END=1140 /DNA_ORIENTATION=-